MNRFEFSVLIIFLISLSHYVIINARDSSSVPLTEPGESKYNYLLFLPEEYKTDKEKKWPLLIYLHGRSVRGNNLEKLKRYGPPAMIKRGRRFPFIVSSPQCPADRTWNNDEWFLPLYRELNRKYRVDPDRVYLTGMSLGGSGVWYTAAKYPQYFAAIIPLCGGGSPKLASRIRHIPVWAFHGKKDRTVPPAQTERMVDALKTCGGDVRFSLLEESGHDIHGVYRDNRIWSWLLKQRRTCKRKVKQQDQTESLNR